MSKIKVCGLRRPEDIEAVNKCKPDCVGFVFANTRRFVSDELAADLKSKLSDDIPAAGVFVNEPMEHIEKLVRSGTIDIVQLHGKEDEAYVDHLRRMLPVGVPIWKAIRVEVDLTRFGVQADEAQELSMELTLEEERFRYASAIVQLNSEIKRLMSENVFADCFLFDSKVKGIPGGSGQNFDLASLPTDEEIGKFYFLAGGVGFGNIERILRQRNPYGVDISTALETDGYKDPEKIERMVNIIRNYVN
ncbi:MAG: phosphoribosylanthranilate isomerase [Lachnospiraceae bacterium]|nr:phosphoribosylanthranilate isomerase [Lachnospiraceae bacterium]